MKKSLYSIKTMVKLNTKAYFRDKVALFFTIAFPLIFLFIFGSLFGKSSNVSFNIALLNESNSQFSKQFVEQASKDKMFKIKKEATNLEKSKDYMNKGQVDAIIQLPQNFGDVGPQNYPTGTATILYNESNAQSVQTLKAVLDGIFQGINKQFVKYDPPFKAELKSTNNTGLTSFDYIFAGMIGFSIIGLGIFGPTQAFPEMKKRGVLRRFRTTPISTGLYVLGNVLTYLVIGLFSLAVMFAVGLLVFDLNMRGNYVNFIAIATLGIITIFGFGLAVGGWAKNEQQAAPLSNLVAFPMMFLSGTFFPTYLMPDWLQTLAKYLPLTPVNDSIRLIITENKSLLDLGPQIGLLGVWIVIIYAITFRVFRWE